MPCKYENQDSLYQGKQKRAFIQKELGIWRRKLGLENFNIMWDLVDQIDDDDTQSQYHAARTYSHPEVFQAYIEFSDLHWTDPHYSADPHPAVRMTIIHELLHVVFAEYVQPFVEAALQVGTMPQKTAGLMYQQIEQGEERMIRVLAEAINDL